MSRYVLGIDSGSTFCKAVLIDNHGNTIDCIAKKMHKTGWQPSVSAENILIQLLKENNVSINDCTIIATGYGRESITYAHKTLTEITCHARGAAYLEQTIEGVIDIGGQDCKLIRLQKGKVIDFIMNDKCTAGTGRFLDMACRTLEIPLENLDSHCDLQNPSPINSMCAVFAESEIIGLIAAQTQRAQILGGVVISIASRIAQMIKKIGFSSGDTLLMTGGLSNFTCVVQAISQISNCSIKNHKDSVFAGALGAALSA